MTEQKQHSHITPSADLPLHERVNVLIGERKAWEKAVLKTNKEHYVLLQGVAIVATSFERDQLTALATKDGFKVAKNTSAFLIVSKLVFGSKSDDDKKRASAFAKAIEYGIAAGTKPEEIAAWLYTVGGVEKARKGTGATGGNAANSPPKAKAASSQPAQAAKSEAESVSSPVISVDDKKPVERAKDFLASAYGTLVINPEYFHGVDLPFVGSGYCAVLFSETHDGQLQPVVATSAPNAVDAVLRAMGCRLDDEANGSTALTTVIIAKANAEADADEAALDALMSEAAQQ